MKISGRNKRISRDDSEGERAWTYQRVQNEMNDAVGGEEEEENRERNRNATAKRLERLPTSVSKYYTSIGEEHKLSSERGWNQVLRTIIAGTRTINDDDSKPTTPLVMLRNHEPTLVRKIISMLLNPMADHVRLTIPAGLFGNGYGSRMRFTYGRDGYENWPRRTLLDEDDSQTDDEKPTSPESKGSQKDGYVAFARCGQVEFPEPNNRNVNMMPFILGDKKSLPRDLLCYHDLIQACPYVQEEAGNVAYLTVQECHVDVGQSQRRGGLHIESPGCFEDNSGGDTTASFLPGVEHPWGLGVFFGPDRYEGGIYFASNRDDTSKVWDALVDSSVPGIVERGGGCEYLREWIGEGTQLKAGELVWMTDRTPHEALPQTTSGHRQFFRLVMPYVSHWYADHSTPNIALPDHVEVIHGNKFSSQEISKEEGTSAALGISQSDSDNEGDEASTVVFTTPEVRDAYYAKAGRRQTAKKAGRRRT